MLELISKNIFLSLKQVVMCKKDCNFDRLLGSNYTTDLANFSKTFMPLVSSTVAPFCRNTLGKYISGPRNNTNASAPLSLSEVLSLTGNGQIPLGSIFTQTEISNIASGDALSVVKQFGDKIDDSSAEILAKKLSVNTSFNDVIHIAAFVRPEILKNAGPSDLANNIDKFSSKVDPNQANVIANRIAVAGTAADVVTLLYKTDSSFADQIPFYLYESKGVNLSTLPDKCKPTSYVIYFFIFLN